MAYVVAHEIEMLAVGFGLEKLGFLKTFPGNTLVLIYEPLVVH